MIGLLPRVAHAEVKLAQLGDRTMEPRISEQDEFLLSQLLDGDLPQADADALRERMASEPDLQGAYDAMASVDGLLAERRSDRVELDWDRFQAEVMADVEASSKTIRFASWFRVGAPMAAAAAIALVFTLSRGPTAENGTSVAQNNPTPSPAGLIMVHIEKPQPASAQTGGKIRINFTRSVELAEAIRLEDEATEQTTSFVNAGSSAPASSTPVLDWSPLGS